MMFRSANETSRRVADGGRQRAGSHGVTQYYADSISLAAKGVSPEAPLPGRDLSGARNQIALIPYPSRSIIPADDPLKPLNLSQARFNEALLFALLVNFGIWALLTLAVWLLFFSRL